MLRQVFCNPDLLIFDHLDLAQCQALIPRFLRRPYTVWAHGIEIWRPLPWLKRRGLLGAASIFFNSQFTKRKAIQQHPWLAQIPATIIPLCIETEGGAEDTSGPGERGARILTVGRLEPSRPKGHREILEALPGLVEKVPNFEWHVAGTGSWFPELERLVARSPAREHITLHGFVDEEELDALYRTSRIFCMPSRGEGFGLVYAEAMRRGCVCIGSIQDAAPEVIGDGGTCIDLANAGTLADTLLNYLTMSPADFEVHSRQARIRSEGFTAARFRDNLGVALDQVLETTRR